MSDETEDVVRRVMTPLIGWPRLDRWLAGVKAQAWQEGYADCMDYHMSNGLKGAEANPYKEEA